MDITILKDRVKEALKGDAFSLDTAILTSPDITAIANDYLPAVTLKIKPRATDPIKEDSDSITVFGTGIDSPFASMSVEARFYIKELNAQLTFTATGDKDWTLEKGFTVFKGTIGASLFFAQTPKPPALILHSEDLEGQPRGLDFYGTIDFDRMSVGVAKLLGIENELISGPAKLTSQGKVFKSIAFKGPDIKNVNLWIAENCKIEFNLVSLLLENPFSGTESALPYLQLITRIPFSSNEKQYEIPVSMEITNWTSPLRLAAEISSLIDATLDALGAFAGKTDLSKTLPPKSQFPVEQILQFTQLYVDIDPQGKEVTNMGLQVASKAEWKLITLQNGKTLNAKDMKLDFMVVKPFIDPKPYLNLGGSFTLTEHADFRISANYPDFEIQGYLTENSKLNIREFIEQFVGPCPDVPDLSITTLEFDLMSGDYSFAIEIVGFWAINSGQNVTLAVNQLGFNVHYTTANGLAAGFYGMFTVGQVGIYITADYGQALQAAESGWTFTGSTAKGQVIHIGEFITYLTRTFGIPDPPDWMLKTTLQDLSTSFETATKNFTFSVTGNIPIAENESLKIKLDYAMTALQEGYDRKFTGELTVHKSIFKLVIENDPEGTSFTGSWEAIDESGYIQFEDLAIAFGFTNPPAVPKELNLALKEAKIFYDFTKSELVLSASSANYGNAVFACKKVEDAWTFIFGLAVSPKTIDLANLPLVGSDLESVVGPVGVKELKIIIATKDLKEPVVKEFNTLITTHASSAYPTIPPNPEGVKAGVYAAIILDLGKDNTYEIQVSTADKQTQNLPVSVDNALTAETGKDNNVYWLDLQKKIGPVYFDKAGVSYADGNVALMLNASLLLTALKVSLIELGVSNPINAFDPDFNLSGLTIAYESGPVTIAGGFVRKEVDGITQYFGAASISVPSFSLSALGAYGKKDGHPSLFIFAMINKPPLGGPPYLYVTGLAGGFGYNRSVKLPAIDDVAAFPFVSGFVPGQSNPFSGNDPNAALKVLVDKNVVPVAIGQNWLAAGIQFSSFQTLQSYALLIVEFGTQLEIGLLGLSTISMPPSSPKQIAYAELALMVRVLPGQGLIAVDARLTQASFILSTSCKLTGGFAFYVWTSPNENAGDFVVTLGGYHPSFQPPKHYPKVPRLGFNWIINPEISIKGGIYFALTPSSIMAGGALEAIFKSGDLKAWFTMGVNFLIAWKPFHYEAQLYLSFGVSYTFRLNLLFATVTKTISVSLGADLTIWGPEFSGVANIHLWIISFKISFGATPNNAPAAIDWDEFTKSFFPAVNTPNPNKAVLATRNAKNVLTTSYCSSKVVRGLVKDLSRDENSFDAMHWIVNRNHTTLETATLFPSKTYTLEIRDDNGPVPSKKITIVNQAELDKRNVAFGVGMVNVADDDFYTEHTVQLEYSGLLNKDVHYEVKAILGNAPKALWRRHQVKQSGKETIENVLIGFEITPIAPETQVSVPIELQYFDFNTRKYKHVTTPSNPDFIDGPHLPDPMKVMMDSINNGSVAETRKHILEALNKRNVPVHTQVNVTEIANSGDDYILAPPVLSYTYWKKETKAA